MVDLAIEKIELLCITSSPEFQLLEQEAGADDEFSFPPAVADALSAHREREAQYETGLQGDGGYTPVDDGGASYFALQKSTRTLLGAIQRAALPELMQAAQEVEDGHSGLGLVSILNHHDSPRMRRACASARARERVTQPLRLDR